MNAIHHTKTKDVLGSLLIFTSLLVAMFGIGVLKTLADDGANTFYVPLIGLTAVPDPLSLPDGPANVTYNFAVKNFLKETPLTDVKVVDDKCGTAQYLTGDDDNNNQLDYSETWRYVCTIKVAQTTESIATATGQANDTTATHKAYATVVVGFKDPAPLISIINITKVAYPLSLPAEGGDITFTYKVNNPGVVPLKDVLVTDNKCRAISSKLGDTNGNNLLDVNEVWVYNCTTHLTETTTNTVYVSGFANGLKAGDNASITVKVEPISVSVPNLPDTGTDPAEFSADIKTTAWQVLAGILAAMILYFILIRRNKSGQPQEKPGPPIENKKNENR